MNLSRVQFQSVTQDSRKAGPGTVFFAIEGSSRDGHLFVERALEAGAPAAVIRASHPLAASLLAKWPGRCVAVVDTRRSLGETAARVCGDPSAKLLVCGVTGTNGKTTSSYLIEGILKEWGKHPALIGTVETRFGETKFESALTTPDAISLQDLFKTFLALGAESVAMEVSSHALDQQRVRGTRFAAVLFTNLTQDHLDYHLTMENYFEAKARLFFEYDVGVRVIHADGVFGSRLLEGCKGAGLPAIAFGARGCEISYLEEGGLTAGHAGIFGTIGVRTACGPTRLRIRSPLLGAFNMQNIAGAAAVGVGLGVPLDVIGRAIASVTAVPGRLERVHNSKGLTVLVDYAHTPDALKKVLQTLKPLCRGKLVCVFGCGGDRDPGKRPLMGAIAEELADSVIVTSDNPRTEAPRKIIDDILRGMKTRPVVIEDRAAAITEAVRGMAPEDILLLAGKGHEDHQIIGTHKIAFDDRAIASQIIDNLQ
ncbi:MAG: UDP-N-acetylmuramoyl-L-alanyl-D-glutamate--2,6-diaminopimelate ligase [Deltaproteobacteria bacterium]|nr:UDP-N-acetylmuramoyl-L-alanyl-D-glutamate--2,6-diaminopimelate ligase [Deltaproteobacteria bacterium]